MKSDVLKACSVCTGHNLNVFDHDAVGGHMPLWWCEDCGSLHLGSNDPHAIGGLALDAIRVWQPEKSMLHYQVLAFHRRFGQSIGEKPHILDHKTMVFRLSLIAEEFCELLDASMDEMASARIEEIREAFAAVIKCPSDIDLPAAVDALADLQYVIEGAAITMGVNMMPILEEVHASNMRKLPSYVAEKDAAHQQAAKRSDGKILKPEGWVGPDISGELKKQGWEE